MNIRLGATGDIHKVGRLWVDMIREIFPDRNPDITAWKSSTSSLFGMKNYQMWIVEDAGKILGFTDYIIQYDQTMSKLILNSFQTYVCPEHRKTGATKLLWTELVKVAKTNKCDKVLFSTSPNLQKYWETIQPGILAEVLMTIDVAAIREV
jgi:hypothetical protein